MPIWESPEYASPLFHVYLIMQWFIKFPFSQIFILKNHNEISTEDKFYQEAGLRKLYCCFSSWLVSKPSILDVGHEITHQMIMMKNFQDVLMEHWKVFSLPLPADILLCWLMVFITEKVILKSDDSFRNAMAMKMHEVILRWLYEVDNSNYLDWVLAEAQILCNSFKAMHQTVPEPSLKPKNLTLQLLQETYV